MRLIIVPAALAFFAAGCGDPPPATSCPSDERALIAGEACNTVAELSCIHGNGQT